MWTVTVGVLEGSVFETPSVKGTSVDLLFLQLVTITNATNKVQMICFMFFYSRILMISHMFVKAHRLQS